MIETAGQTEPPQHEATRLRLITATSLFDGHDVAIHIMRQLIQTHSIEVVHLGHHRSAEDVARAAVQEDVDAIVMSNHRGGHVEYFACLIGKLRAHGAGHIPVFVCTGDLLSAEEIAELTDCGVPRVYHIPTGSTAALTQMVNDVVVRADRRHHLAVTVQAPSQTPPPLPPPAPASDPVPAPATPAITPSGAVDWWPGARPQPAPDVPASPLQVNEVRWDFTPAEHASPTTAPPPHAAPSPVSGSASPDASPAPESSHLTVTEDTPTPAAVHDSEYTIARMLTRLEEEHQTAPGFHELRRAQPWAAGTPPVIGITGTGGAGKSSVTDELLIRFLVNFPNVRIAVLSVDPTRRRSGGALLGDRIRMNALRSPRVYMRSMATRRQHVATSAVLQDCIQYLKGQDFDLIIVETAGIGQSDSTIVDLVDVPMYVMTSDYGASSQLEKIDMLDFAEMIILNKYDQRGAVDALRDLRQQWRRRRQTYDLNEDQIPVYPTIASQCNDPGMTWMFVNLCHLLRARLSGQQVASPARCDFNPHLEITETLPNVNRSIPLRRSGYLADIAEQGRAINARLQSQVKALEQAQPCWHVLGDLLHDPLRPVALQPYPPEALNDASVDASLITLRRSYHEAITSVNPESLQLLQDWQRQHASISADLLPSIIDTRRFDPQSLPTITTPVDSQWGDVLRFLAGENISGDYPDSSGLRTGTIPEGDRRVIIADAGTPERGNQQFHAARQGNSRLHLVTVFDSVTLYGEDPDERLDIYGKIGDGGVSLPTLDAMKKLYSGFDLCAADISVAMTVNGPAPILLAMFINTAIDQQVEKYLKQDPERWQQAQQKIDTFSQWHPRPDYELELPPGHDALGLGLLGINAEQLVDPDTYARIKTQTLSNLRGRVRIDILEQDQARNTCIFSPEFSLRMLGDMQQYFIEHKIEQLQTIAVSGTDFAAAGASPITQLAFALANGFTMVEYYLARGLTIDQIVPAMHFFFSIGDDLEGNVLGRVARCIWVRAMREYYGAHPDQQKLHYQIDAHLEGTSRGEPSPHDAISPHSLLRRKFDTELYEAPWQGSFIIRALTDLMEEAVYREFDALNARGGVLAAMSLLYQREKLQDEWMQRAHSASVSAETKPLQDGHAVPAATRPEDANTPPPSLTAAEKTRQIANLQFWNGLHRALSTAALDAGKQPSSETTDAPEPDSGLAHLQQVARGQGNLFAVLMDVVKTHSLGQITHALYAAGGEYRRTI